MRVRLVEGDVQVRIAETGEWAPASVNMPLVEEDELWVPEGGLSAIQMNNGAYVRPTRSILQFDTPDSSIRTFRNSTFRIDIPDGETDVLVFRGTITAENAGGTTSVVSGSMLVLGADGYAELSPLPPPDGGPKDRREGNEAVPPAGQGTRPFRHTAASAAPLVGGKKNLRNRGPWARG
jgi:hypothetical protein